MAAVSTKIDKVMRDFLFRDPVLTLNTALADGSGTAVLVDDVLPNIGVGSIIMIDAELMFVSAVSSTTPMTLTVVRGWLDSVAVAHNAVGLPVFVNPRVLRQDVLDFMNECLHIIFPTVYKVTTVEKVYASADIGYDLVSTLQDIIAVNVEMDADAKYWKPIGDYKFIPNANTTSFPSGKAVMVRVSLPTGALIRVTYSEPFTQIATEADDLESALGLADFMTDLPFYYAMSRLMAIEEVERSDSKSASSHQRAQDVPGFLALRTGEWYKTRYDDLLENSANRLTEANKPTILSGYGS